MQQQLSNNLLTLGCIDEKVSMLRLSMQEKKNKLYSHIPIQFYQVLLYQDLFLQL